MLDNRLKMCADMVGGDGIVCDVGTDHGHLAAELIKSGKCGRVIASDIKEGPLASARKTVEKYGLSDKIELVLSDGLKNIDLENVSDIVVAGMGGETIIKIIGECDKALDDIRLILQPMTKHELLRKWLYKAGFSIASEKAVEESGKMYTVIAVQKGIAPHRELTEFESISGFFDEDDSVGKKYRIKESERLAKAAEQLKTAGRIKEETHFSAMSKRLVGGDYAVNADEIYNFFDEKYPFSLQEKWDNSGFLIKSRDVQLCNKILLTLDITNSVIEEAVFKGINLIISHHPVIFEPLKTISYDDPVYKLIEHRISAICMHTNLDIANGGTNTEIVDRIAGKLEISENIEPLEDSGLGCIIEFKNAVDTDCLLRILKDIFGTACIRMNINHKDKLSKIAICSGSGGSLWTLARDKGCDALITGDVKHNIWIEANDSRFTVFDCGHFNTENIVLWELRRVLEEEYPMLDIEISENSADPCEYYAGE